MHDHPVLQLDGLQRRLVSEYGLGFQDYLRAIPYMFYPLAMMLLCLLLALGVFPKLGVLRLYAQRGQP